MSTSTSAAPKDNGQAAGLACPNCGCRHLPVVYTRHRHGRTIRVRECRHCQRRIQTYEQIVGSGGSRTE